MSWKKGKPRREGRKTFPIGSEMRDSDYLLSMKLSLSLGLFAASLMSIYLPGLAEAHKWLFLGAVWLVDRMGVGWLDLFLGTILFWLIDMAFSFVISSILLKKEEKRLLLFKKKMESRTF